METQKWLLTVDRISTWVGKAFAWLIVALMLMVVVVATATSLSSSAITCVFARHGNAKIT